MTAAPAVPGFTRADGIRWASCRAISAATHDFGTSASPNPPRDQSNRHRSPIQGIAMTTGTDEQPSVYVEMTGLIADGTEPELRAMLQVYGAVLSYVRPTSAFTGRTG